MTACFPSDAAIIRKTQLSGSLKNGEVTIVMVAKNYEIRAMHKSELVIKVGKMERQENEDTVFSKSESYFCVS